MPTACDLEPSPVIHLLADKTYLDRKPRQPDPTSSRGEVIFFPGVDFRTVAMALAVRQLHPEPAQDTAE